MFSHFAQGYSAPCVKIIYLICKFEIKIDVYKDTYLKRSHNLFIHGNGLKVLLIPRAIILLREIVCTKLKVLS